VKRKTPPAPENVPQHIVLIPDGNGRWAQERSLPVAEGHRRGAKAVEAFLKVCRDWDVPYATIWGFSTENWKRSGAEIGAIMKLVEGALRRNRKNFARDGIRFIHLGRRDRLAEQFPRLHSLLLDLADETAGNEPFTLNLALDYGGRDEIVRAARRLMTSGRVAEEVDWTDLAALLDTAGQPDPDLVIRTSGEHRLSGILPLQAAYAEMIFLPDFLPGLSEDNFREAIREFARRDRRFGQRPTA